MVEGGTRSVVGRFVRVRMRVRDVHVGLELSSLPGTCVQGESRRAH